MGFQHHAPPTGAVGFYGGRTCLSVSVSDKPEEGLGSLSRGRHQLEHPPNLVGQNLVSDAV